MTKKPGSLVERLKAAADAPPPPAAPAPPETPAPASSDAQPAPRQGRLRTAMAGEAASPPSKAPPHRANRGMIGGYFSKELATAMRILAAEKGTTIQALLGEGMDLVLRANGKHPFGER